jgi:hypothetical protein
VRNQPHEIEPGKIDETWAKHAKQLAAEDPTILDDQKRLLAAIRGWSRPKKEDLLESLGDWLFHNGRVDRNCISNAEYERRMEERRAAGLLIDPSTAVIGWWYARCFDPYTDGIPVPPGFATFGRTPFARAPDSDIWVDFGDLPDATLEAIRKRFENTKEDPNYSDDDIPF